MSYEDYRNNKMESGLRYQDFVIDLCHQTRVLVIQQYASRFYQTSIGESVTGVEIKHDEKYAKTNNLWIEVAEKARPRAGDYVPSGICRDDNSWLYIIGNYDIVFIFPKRYLLALKANEQRYPIRTNKTATSRGYLLPHDVAHKLAAYVLTPNAEQKVSKAVTDLQQLGRELHRIVLSNPAQRTLFDDDAA